MAAEVRNEIYKHVLGDVEISADDLGKNYAGQEIKL
jgi:hypothetical protein